jgi:hypothetical protein
MGAITHYRELKVYQNALELALKVFAMTKAFDQIIGQIVKRAGQPEKRLLRTRSKP